VDSCEALDFLLQAPLCVVHAVQLRPFRAWFQEGEPVYSPQRLRLRISPTQSLAALARAGAPAVEGAAAPEGMDPATGVYLSAEFSVRQSDELQTFAIPPALCTNGALRVELLGRTQRQEVDGGYYSESAASWGRRRGTLAAELPFVGGARESAMRRARFLPH
jgi:hypothetical protein